MKSIAWWHVCLILVSGGIALALPAAVNSEKIPFTWPTVAEWIDVGKLLLSWPVAITLLFVIFIRTYREEVRAYLAKLGPIKVPGILEVQPQQLPVAASSVDGVESAPDEIAADLAEAIVASEATRDVASVVEHEDDATSPGSQPLGDVAVDALASVATTWRFRYLDLFLVEYSKRALVWLAVMPQPRATYEYIWQYVIPTAEQRNTVVEALKAVGMIEEMDGILRVTRDGHMFIEFLRHNGKLPPQSTPSVSPPLVPAEAPAPTPAPPPPPPPPSPSPPLPISVPMTNFDWDAFREAVNKHAHTLKATRPAVPPKAAPAPRPTPTPTPEVQPISAGAGDALRKSQGDQGRA